jgi:cytochrome c2
MPAYDLSEEEIHALTVLLKSFRDEKIPKEFTKSASSNYVDIQNGRKLIKKYNCIVCHEVEKGWGGKNILLALRANYDENIETSLLPPVLMGEGNKVQSKWLFDYISEPTAIRPWLTLTMPTFNLTSKESNDIVKYFQALSGVEISYHFWKKTFHSQTEKNEAKKLFETLKCVRCHSFGKDETLLAGELAPDLSLTKHRLKPDWIRNWLRNPQKLQSGTKMPNYFLIIEDDGEVVELLPKPEKKIDLLVRFLFEM